MKKIIKSLTKRFFGLFGFDLVRKQDLADFYLHEYDSYEDYRRIQVFHNKRKIQIIWADERTLDRVAALACNGDQRQILGLCHGTRNGYEQNYLNSLGLGIHAIGTDISETALDYPNSFQWDFHDINAEWVNHFDFIYTNSLDQSWKPKEALKVWLDQLKEDGMLIVEHTEMHGPRGASEMDPFGVRPAIFPYVLTMWFGDKISISHSVEKKKNMNLDAWLFVIRKSDPSHKFSQ